MNYFSSKVCEKVLYKIRNYTQQLWRANSVYSFTIFLVQKARKDVVVISMFVYMI